MADVVWKGKADGIDTATAHALRTYTRVKRWGVLPRSGGLDAQAEKTMRLLETIDEAFASERERKQAFEDAKKKAHDQGGHHFVGRS